MNYEDKVHDVLTMPAISVEYSGECPEIKVVKTRRRGVQNLATIVAALAATAPPGFMGTAEAMMGSPYKPPIQPQLDSEQVDKLRKAEEKRQRRLERNKRNRPIRGSL